MADIPGNSHLGFEFITSMSENELPEWITNNWQTTAFHTYVKFREGTDTEKLIRRIEAGANKERASHIHEGDKYTYILQPLKDIHLHSDISGEFQRPGNPVYLTIFGVIAGFILLIASINYINLSTAQFTLRNKEVCLRKVFGAERRSLIIQFYCETVLILLISCILAFVIVLVSLPYFMNMTDTFSSLKDLGSIKILYVLAGIILLTGLIAGSYPAFFLSSQKPVNMIKSEHGAVSGGRNIKRAMVVGQFIISFILIAMTIAIYQQVHYMRNKDLGFKEEQKIVIPIRQGASISENYNTVKAEFLRDPLISDAVVSSGVPGRSILSAASSLVNEAEEMKQAMMYLFVDNDYLSNYGIELCAGRTFRKGKISDQIQEFVINETAVRCFGWTEPEEAHGKIVSGFGGYEGEIIGVVRDFHFEGLRTQIEPLLISNSRPDTYSYLTLSLASGNNTQNLSSVENTWDRLFPGIPFDYYYLDTDFDRFYTEEFMTVRLVSIFSTLAMVLTCLGILGLAIHITQSRKKEVGIRRANGASEKGITLLFTSEFIRWIILATLLASPIAFIIINKWLKGYAYSINFSLWFLLLPGIVIFCLTILTVSYHTIKAARANPVDSLRYE